MADTRWGGLTPETRIETSHGGRTISGYAAVYWRADDPGTQFVLGPKAIERITPGAFDRAISEHQDVRALMNHDPDNLLGRTSSGTLKLTVNKRGLRYEIPYDEHDPDHQRVKRKLEKGDISGSSFAFVPTSDRFEVEGDDVEVRYIDDLDLYDVGPETYPAYHSATSGVRSEDRSEYGSSLQKYHDMLDVLSALRRIDLS